jgi:hypothetical protein
MAGVAKAALAFAATTLHTGAVVQAGDPESAGDVLWLIGGGVLALLALGFILTRRTRQRTSEPVFDNDHAGPIDDDGEYVEPLL